MLAPALEACWNCSAVVSKLGLSCQCLALRRRCRTSAIWTAINTRFRLPLHPRLVAAVVVNRGK